MLVTIHSNVEYQHARLGDGGWTIMTTNHPVPTPPPAELAPSLRPVEEPCGFAIIDDGEVRPCERPATGWRWYQDCGHEDMIAMACDGHENEGGRRLAAANRENAELRGEVERLRRQVIDHAWTANDIDQSLRDRLSVVTRYRHERDDLRAQLAAAQAQLAEAQEHADMRDKVIREWERVHWRDVDRMTAAIKAAEDVTRRIPSPFADNVARAVRAALSAPQPEPVPKHCGTRIDRRTCVLGYRHEGDHEWWPPASDEPAASGTPDGGS